MLTLRKMQVANAEFGTRNVYWEEDLGSATEILDVTISPVLRPPWNCPGSFLANLLLEIASCGASVHTAWLWRLSDSAVQVCMCGYELCFARVPCLEDLGGGCTSEDARVDQAGEADAGDVAAGAEDAFEVPDGFCAEVNRQYARGSVEESTHGLGYSSSKKPPPFSFAKMPVKPQGWSCIGWTSWISTTSTSPGSAVSISNGPVR